MRSLAIASTLVTPVILAAAFVVGTSTVALASGASASASASSVYPELKLQMGLDEVGAELAKFYGTQSVSLSSCVLNHEDKEPVEVCFVNGEDESFRKMHVLTFHKNKLAVSIIALTALEEGGSTAQQQYSAITAKFEQAYGKPVKNQAYGKPVKKQGKEGQRLEWSMNKHQWANVSQNDNRVTIVMAENAAVTSKNRLYGQPDSAYRRAWAYLDPTVSDELTLGLADKLMGIVENPMLASLSRPVPDSAEQAVPMPEAFSALRLGLSVEEAGQALTRSYGTETLRNIECVTRVAGKETLETCTLLAGFQKIALARPHAYQSLMFNNGVLIGSYFLMNTYEDAAIALSEKSTGALLSGITAKYGTGVTADILGHVVHSWSLPQNQALTALYEDNSLALVLYDKARSKAVTEQDWSQGMPSLRKPWAALSSTAAQGAKLH